MQNAYTVRLDEAPTLGISRRQFSCGCVVDKGELRHHEGTDLPPLSAWTNEEARYEEFRRRNSIICNGCQLQVPLDDTDNLLCSSCVEKKKIACPSCNGQRFHPSFPSQPCDRCLGDGKVTR